MRGAFVLALSLCFLFFSCQSVQGNERKKAIEDEFDEFEFEFEVPEEEKEESEGDNNQDQNQDNEQEEDETEGDHEDATVEDEFDTEEFESASEENERKTGKDYPDLTIEESAVRIKPFFEAYLIELCICLGIALYGSNYIMGRMKNTSIAEGWMLNNLTVLQNEFSIVGDDGEGDEPSQSHIVRRSDSSFTVWASGRVNCNGLLVHLELMKRHDLISVITGLFRPVPDSLSFIFQLDDQDMESIIVAIAPRREATRLSKEYEDLSRYCSGIRAGDKHNLPSSLSVVSETYDSVGSVLSGGMAKFLSSHGDDLLSLHISDQYTGIKETDESDKVIVKKPEKRIHLTFKFPADPSQSIDYLVFALKLLDHVKGIKLSREARDKAIKNRQLAVQEQEKLQHQQRQEAAQQRREDKKKAEKEKMLEADADKARKWEEKEYKKQMKRSQPRMKQMKVRMG